MTFANFLTIISGQSVTDARQLYPHVKGIAKKKDMIQWPLFLGYLAILIFFFRSRDKVRLPKLAIDWIKPVSALFHNNDRLLVISWRFWSRLFPDVLYMFKNMIEFPFSLILFLHGYGLHPDTVNLSTVSHHLAVDCLNMGSIPSPCQPTRQATYPFVGLWCCTCSLSSMAGPLGSDLYISFRLYPPLSLSCCRSSATVHQLTRLELCCFTVLLVFVPIT